MGVEMQSPLPEAMLGCAVIDAAGGQLTLRELIEGRAALLVFVRHFGCIGCSENIGLLSPRFAELSDLGMRIVVIGCGPALFIDGFRERHRLLHGPAEVYTDPTLAIQRAAGLAYGLWGGFRPRAVYEQARAFVNGHVFRSPEGDIRQQAGAVIVDMSGVVRLSHRSESLGDHVRGQQIVDVALAIWLEQNPDVV